MVVRAGWRWDRTTKAYVEEWQPRFVPHHLDLARELGLGPGDRVAVIDAGPDVLPFARAVAPHGRLHVQERDRALRVACEGTLARAGLHAQATFADDDSLGTDFDAVVCAFGRRQVAEGRVALAKWRDALKPNGKLGVMVWGPAHPDDPLDWLAEAANQIDPALDFRRVRVDTDRAALAGLMESAGLALVRHTVVQHNVTFRSALDLVKALVDASEWRAEYATLPQAVASRMTARVCELAGGPDAPVVFDLVATIAIAGLPGAEIELPHRPSVKVPVTA